MSQNQDAAGHTLGQRQTDYPLYERIYQVVQQVPLGMVTTYRDVASIVGGGCDARTVGQALNAIPKAQQAPIPWQRVIARDGAISTRGLLQRQILEAEGIEFDLRDRVIMARFCWNGPPAEWAAAHGYQTLAPRTEADRAEQLSLF